MPLSGLVGKGFVVTGAARGIGAATAARLSAEGARTLLVDLDEKEVEGVAAGLDGAAAFAADTSTEEGVAGYIAAAKDHLGKLDGSFLNAGIAGDIAMIADYDIGLFDRVVAVNVRGTFLGLRATIGELTATGTEGAIVATASVLSSQGSQFFAPYVATKHAVMGLVRSAALEVGAQGIRVNAVCPGYVATRLVDNAENFAAAAVGADAGAVREAFHAGVPLARYGEPAEMAATVAWLLSDESAYATGAGFALDGGVSAGPYSSNG